jgi:hypothetical protein
MRLGGILPPMLESEALASAALQGLAWLGFDARSCAALEPLARCTSTVTAWASRASRARLWTTAKDMSCIMPVPAQAQSPGVLGIAHEFGASRSVLGPRRHKHVEAGADSSIGRIGMLSA